MKKMEPGEKVEIDECNTCKCSSSNAYSSQPECTELASSIDDKGNAFCGCKMQDEVFPVGSIAKDSWDKCCCRSDGSFSWVHSKETTRVIFYLYDKTDVV